MEPSRVAPLRGRPKADLSETSVMVTTTRSTGKPAPPVVASTPEVTSSDKPEAAGHAPIRWNGIQPSRFKTPTSWVDRPSEPRRCAPAVGFGHTTASVRTPSRTEWQDLRRERALHPSGSPPLLWPVYRFSHAPRGARIPSGVRSSPPRVKRVSSLSTGLARTSTRARDATPTHRASTPRECSNAGATRASPATAGRARRSRIVATTFPPSWHQPTTAAPRATRRLRVSPAEISTSRRKALAFAS